MMFQNSVVEDYIQPNKFLVFSCLAVFSLLFSLRLDGSVKWSYWVIFLPIWIWKLTVITGAGIGSYVWWKHPQYRMEGDGYIQYKAMIISTGMHLLLLMFEILSCENLETENHSWILVFIPIMFMSVISVGICIWAVKNERSFELEMFCSVNVLQFIFLALRLDGVIEWSWVIVFIPLWIVMCVALIGVVYAIILAIILIRSPDIIPEQRRGNIYSAIGYSFMVVPLLVFEILLANRLDGDYHLKFSAICVPLMISLITMICLSFGAKGGNIWWFGIRKDFCQFLLGVCPFLQEYGNITYSLHKNDSQAIERDEEADKTTCKRKREPIDQQPRTVVDVMSIEMPD